MLTNTTPSSLVPLTPFPFASFSPSLPSSGVPGIDVSRYQGQINWPLVAKAGIRFAAARATVGDYYTDPLFKENWQGMKEAGILRAAYHVLTPDKSATAQALRFLASLDGDPGELPIVLDIELHRGKTKKEISTNITDWLLFFKSYISPTHPVIFYTSPWFWNTYVNNLDVSNTDLWIANYNVSDHPNLPKGWLNWRIWQYSNKGSIPGIAANVDLDLFNGSESDFNAWLNLTVALTIEQRISRLEEKVFGSQNKALYYMSHKNPSLQ